MNSTCQDVALDNPKRRVLDSTTRSVESSTRRLLASTIPLCTVHGVHKVLAARLPAVQPSPSRLGCNTILPSRILVPKDLFKREYVRNLESPTIMARRHATPPKSDNRLRVAKEILSLGSPVAVACQFCFNHSCPCITMEGYKKCAECTRRGKPCVGVSWDSLDRVRAKLESDIQNAESEQNRLLSEQTRVASKLNRLRKELHLAKDRARLKTLCLVQELSDDEEAVENPPTETLSQLFDSMPELWQSDPLSPSQSVEASSRNR